MNVHFPLEGGTDIYQSERHFPLGVGAPWGEKGGFKLV
jgi:hypothetical protein